MPVLKSGFTKNVPEWADYSDWGVSHMPKGQKVDRHFHDAHEFVLVVSGKIQVDTEGAVTDLGAGDAVLTKMGDEHEWLALEDSVAIWAVSKLMGAKRPGHLFREKAD